MSLSRLFPGFYLFLNGAAYCILAWLFLVEPLAWFDRLQVNLVDIVGYTELKTMYVGVMAALGLFFVVASLVESWRQPAVWLAIFSYLGLASVRGWGIFVDQVFNELIYQLFGIEVLDLLAGFLALYCLQLAKQKRRNPYY